MARGPFTIAIVGGGFSGAVAAMTLLDGFAGTSLRVVVAEPQADLGRGLAFSTRNPGHFLNGPAKNFSVHPDRPDHLVAWLAARPDGEEWRSRQPGPLTEAFVPRWIYGDYVRAELARAVAEAGPEASLEHLRARAVDLAETADGVRLTLSDGNVVSADLVLLALGVFGNRPPFPATGEVVLSGRYVADPWTLEGIEVPRTGTVVFVGGGLTMLDALVTLEQKGFRGRHISVSRHGLVVQARREPLPLRDFLAEAPLPDTALGLFRRVRRELRGIAMWDGDWQAFVPALRPHVAPLWARASDRERARFLRHLKRYWDLSLHRGPGPSMALLERVRAEGRFASRAARISYLTAGRDGRIDAVLAPRGGRAAQTIVADLVVNCTGAEYAWPKLGAAPLVGNLLSRGLVRPGPLGLGIDADQTAAVIGADGTASRRIYGIGPILRGVRWESTTIAELVAQAAAFGALVAGRHAAALQSSAA